MDAYKMIGNSVPVNLAYEIAKSIKFQFGMSGKTKFSKSFINCLKRSVKKPYLILGFIMFIGYLCAFCMRHEKIVNKELGRFIRKYRYKKILK